MSICDDSWSHSTPIFHRDSFRRPTELAKMYLNDCTEVYDHELCFDDFESKSKKTNDLIVYDNVEKQNVDEMVIENKTFKFSSP